VLYQNIRSPSFSFVTIHVSDGQTDRQRDRQNYDSNTVHCITCSRMVANTACDKVAVMTSSCAQTYSYSMFEVKIHQQTYRVISASYSNS